MEKLLQLCNLSWILTLDEQFDEESSGNVLWLVDDWTSEYSEFISHLIKSEILTPNVYQNIIIKEAQ